MEKAVTERKALFESGILLALFALIGLGLVMVYSATVYQATAPKLLERTQGNGMFYLERQLVFAFFGLAALAICTFMPFSWFKRLAVVGLLLGLLSMTLVLVLGREVGGAVRWFDLGAFKVQPGEFVKLAFVLWVARSLSRKGEAISRISMGLLPHLLVAFVLVGLYMAQPDLGSSIILGALLVAMLFVAGLPWKHIGLLLVGGGSLVAAVLRLSPERWNRVTAWVDPAASAQGEGFQLLNALLSIGSGGLAGSGLGAGRQNIAGFLSEGETDFIFAVIGEELGFIGCTAVIALFGYILWRGMRLAATIRDPFARSLVFGATLLVVVQAAINVGVNTGLLPTKGLTLPFISLGGSSMLVMCSAVGIILNASRTQPRLVKVPAEELRHQVAPTEVEVLVKEAA